MLPGTYVSVLVRMREYAHYYRGDGYYRTGVVNG